MTGTGSDTKPICVVLDTNIWVYKTSLLRTTLGAALTNALVRLRGVIGLPEVIEEETIKHTAKVGRGASAQISENLEKIARLTGYVHAYAPLAEGEFEAGAKERLRELEDLLQRVPYNFEQLRAALQRVMEETPPNAPKNQQYKDSVIWEAVLELSGTHTVHFVTEDKAFFEGKNPDRGLATNLEEESEVEGREIYLHYGIESCLESLRGAVPPLDYSGLARAVDHAIKGNLLRFAHDKEFELGELIASEISAFLTENSDELALSFELSYQASVVLSSGEEIDATLMTKGDCSYSFREDASSEVREDYISLLGPEGNLIEGKGISYVYAGSISSEGTRRIPYSLREQLD